MAVESESLGFHEMKFSDAFGFVIQKIFLKIFDNFFAVFEIFVAKDFCS